MSPPDLLPCPVCHGEADLCAGYVMCEPCGIATRPIDPVPLECFGPSTSYEEAEAWTVAEAWNQLPARELLAIPCARLLAMASECSRAKIQISTLQASLIVAQCELKNWELTSIRRDSLQDHKAEVERARADLERAKRDRDIASRQALTAAHEADLLRARAERAERELQKWVPRSRGVVSAADPGDLFALIEVD